MLYCIIYCAVNINENKSAKTQLREFLFETKIYNIDLLQLISMRITSCKNIANIQGNVSIIMIKTWRQLFIFILYIVSYTASNINKNNSTKT